jgi:organic hydroperoxide reductase OsmC/OhrA
MLWYLGLCSAAGVTVLDYEDQAEGLMVEEEDGAGRFTQVTLRPRITIAAQSDLKVAESLHHAAHARCFIANSVNFDIKVAATVAHSKGASSEAP